MLRTIWILTVILFSTLLRAQHIQNSDFSIPCDNLTIESCTWTKSWGPKDCCRIENLSAQTYLLISGKSENSVGFIEQSIEIPELSVIKILKISASIKTMDVVGKGAGINIGMYNKEGELISTKDMGGFYSNSWIKSTHDWNQDSISTICPAGTTTIKVGAILYGQGAAYFDNFELQMLALDNRKPSSLAHSYITEAIDIISENSLVRDSLDLEEIKHEALMIAGNAQSHAECHLAIEYILSSLRIYGDEHSYFMTAQEVDKWENDTNPTDRIDFPVVERQGNYGYILVPPFHAGNDVLMRSYADSLQAGLEKIFSEDIKGWIVDLRQNTGGNMEPMITGLGPLLDEGPMGALIDVNGNKESWYYRSGTYYWEEKAGISVNTPFQISKDLPIAVLISSRTGSSGEIVAISFIGNTKTRLFGERTWGLTTGNGEFELGDKAKMLLASTKMMDRNGKVYTSYIEPDFVVAYSKVQNEDLVQKAAIEWLEKQ